MAALKYFNPILKWITAVADESTDTDADPQIKGIFGGCTVSASIGGADARAIRVEDLSPSAALLALSSIEARLDDGRLMLRADSDKAATSYANLAAFPTTGATNHLYRALDTNLFYEWNGTAYFLSVDYARLRLVATCPVLDLPDNVFVWYTFRFHHVTYNGKSQELPTITVAAPFIAEVHNDITDGEVTFNLATAEWVDPADAIDGAILVRNVPDEVARVADTVVFKRLGVLIPGSVDISDFVVLPLTIDGGTP